MNRTDGDTHPAFDPVSLEILWGRVVAALDEAELSLIRTSFSLIVREAYDFACVLMDTEGNSVGQSWRSQPSFVGTLPNTLQFLLERLPREEWRPGDVVITNDPWMGTGHLPDLSMVTPIFYRERLIGFFGTVAHKPDIGGAIWSADCSEVFEEGLCIPILKLYRAGEPNQDVIDIINANVRVPEMVMGDIHAQIVASNVGSQRLVELLEEAEMDDPAPLFTAIVSQAEASMRRAIGEVPDGVYTHSITTDGVDHPLHIQVKLTVRGQEIEVDYTGTSDQVRYGINDPYNHSFAYSVFPIKCALDPLSPNNGGAFRPVKVFAPEGSLLNPRFPAPVASRQMTGHFLAAAILGTLAKAIPDKVIADCGSPANRSMFSGFDNQEKRWSQQLLTSGGMGASTYKDGVSGTPYPTNAVFPPVEMLESVNPLIFLEKAFIRDSGGAGRHRGGLGQSIILQFTSENPTTVSLMMDRMQYPPQGLFGGLPGGPADAKLNYTQPINPKGRTVIRQGDILTIVTPGGAGYGPPGEREVEAILEDLRQGYISPEAAEELYKLSSRAAPARPA